MRLHHVVFLVSFVFVVSERQGSHCSCACCATEAAEGANVAVLSEESGGDLEIACAPQILGLKDSSSRDR